MTLIVWHRSRKICASWQALKFILSTKALVEIYSVKKLKTMSEYLIDSNGLKIEFHFEDSEASKTLVFLPRSYANTSVWKGITKALEIPFKKVFTILRGYGNTEESRSAEEYKIDNQIEIIRAISKKFNSNFHIVGHFMGGLVGFAAVFSGEFP